MDKVEKIIREYLPKINIMQLATSSNDQPWVCTVHYYTDEDLNFYWISTPERRHSQDIAQNPKVATTVMAHENTLAESYIIGISVEGTAELVGKDIPVEIEQAYTAKLNKDPDFMREVRAGKNPHKFYKLTPSKIVIFDTKNFPDDPRQEWRP